jgi:site-specific recombinase XerD
MLLSEAIEELAIATRAEGRSPQTVKAYREKLSYLVAFLGDVPIEKITVGDLRRYIAHLWDRKLSPFTVKSRVRHLKRLFNFAQEEEMLKENPSKRIKTPSPRREKPKGIEWEDFIALLKTTEGGTLIDVRDRAVILFLFDTGCRVGGLAGLTVDDLDLERQQALVKEKGNKTRFVFFEEETVWALEAWLEVRPQDQGPWLFVALNNQGDGLSDRGVYRMLRRRGEAAGCTGPVNPHAFRHGFARHYLMDSGDLGTLSDILGHSDVSVTKSFYGVFTTAELQEKHRQHSPISKLRSGENEN